MLSGLAEELGEQINPDLPNRVDQIIGTGDSAQLEADTEINLRILEMNATDNLAKSPTFCRGRSGIPA